jgi:hypothetical protein
MLRFIRAVLAFAVAFLLMSCGGGGGGGSGGSSAPAPANNTGGPTTAVVALPTSTLAFFTVTTGGASTTLLGYDSSGNSISVDTTQYQYSMLVPSRSQWVVLSTHTSASYAAQTIAAFVQDDRVFRVREDPSGFGRNDFAEFNVLTNQFGVQIPFVANNMVIPQHIGFLGDRLFYRERVTISGGGGQFKVNNDWDSGGTTTTLFQLANVENQATYDLADGGKLYAITHAATSPGTFAVQLRDAITGQRTTLVRSLSLPEQPLYANLWSMKINKGVLYVARQRIADNVVEILSTDLNIANTALGLAAFTTFAPSEGNFQVFDSLWGVDDGRVAFAFGPSAPAARNSIALFDAGVKSYYSLGANTNIASLAVMFRN